MKAGNMENKFSALGVDDNILKAINELGFESPTDVQEESIPKILEKKDLIVMSKTGSGKTAAFGIPILQQMDRETHEPNALILAPTRELAVQVEKDIKQLSKYSEVRTTAVYGQHNMESEIKALKQGIELVCGTPGRVYDHIKRKTLKTSHIEFLVLDEADRMLDMGFYDQVVQIIKALPRKRVTLLFSATMPPEIKRICQSYMNEPVTVELETDTMTVDTVKQFYFKVEQNQKRMQLVRLLKYYQPESCMVFCNTRDEVDRVQVFLQNNGFWAEALHGANNQNQRMRTIDKFKAGNVQVMVATDVAARGIHIDDLSLVVNYDVPDEKNSYVHRVGRTGRAGNKGVAISIVTSDTLMTLYEIEEHVGLVIEDEVLPTDEMVAEAVANADNKWASMDLPPKVKAKSRDRDHRSKHHGSDRNRGNRSGDRQHKDRQHRDSAQKKQHSQKTHADKTQKPVAKHTAKHTEKHTPKPKTHVKPVQERTASTSQTKSVVKSTPKPSTPKPLTPKPSTHKPTKPKVRTEMKKTKGLGEIEFIVREEKKTTVLSKVKGFFVKK